MTSMDDDLRKFNEALDGLQRTFFQEILKSARSAATKVQEFADKYLEADGKESAGKEAK